MSDTVSMGAANQKVCPQCGKEYPFEQRFCPDDGTTLRAKNASGDLVGTIIADRYHVVKKLGEGGMGQVYLAEHVKMGRKSAVKVMNPGMTQDPDAISRFNREAANASRINHPNVAAIYDFGETPEGIIFLAMEFVEGMPLTTLIEQQGALNPARAGSILQQAGDALAVAHDLGIVHRDLKPDNIMIAKGREGSDLVKVVDFGIAKAGGEESQKVTKTGLVVGTPEYMSPEQLAGDKLDGRSDIYSLALVAFNMLTGRLPFPSETVQESMIMRLTDRPKTLSEMKPEVPWPPQLQTVMDKALARASKERYQSAAEFGRDFARAVMNMGSGAAVDPSEAGTQVLGAPVVPPTRVASAAPAGAGAGGTVAMNAPVAPSPAVTPAGKSKAPVFAGVGVVVLAIAGGAFFMMQNRNKPEETAQPSVATVPAPSGGTPAGQSPSAPVSSGASGSSTPTTTSTLSRPVTGGTPATIAPKHNAALDRLLTQAESVDEKAAQSVLLGIDAIEPDLTTASDKATAKYIRAQALLASGKDAEACALYKQVMQDQAANSQIKASARNTSSGACQ